jgi:hypothetical protein
MIGHCTDQITEHEPVLTFYFVSLNLIALIKAAVAQTRKPRPADKILCI